MTLDSKTFISATEANQNFSKVTRLVDECGSATIIKNNVPRYLVIDIAALDSDSMITDEVLQAVSHSLIAKNRRAYEELAK